MKSPYISELEPNQIDHRNLSGSSQGRSPEEIGRAVSFPDRWPTAPASWKRRCGTTPPKCWTRSSATISCASKGCCQIFQNRPQLTVHKILPVADSEVDFADYFPASKRDRDEMFRELARPGSRRSTNPHLKALLEAIFADEAIALAYRTAPAAKSVHHAWLGGLIEHVLSLCHLAKFTAAHYRGHRLRSAADRRDPARSRQNPRADLRARLRLHHRRPVAGAHRDRRAAWWRKSCAGCPDFPPPLRDLLLHMILSHHGELEFGSPKVPLFAEALLLHHLDNLDSKMECIRGLVESDRLIEGVWTGYSSALDRSVLKKRKFLEPPLPATGITRRNPRLLRQDRRSRSAPRILHLLSPRSCKSALGSNS